MSALEREIIQKFQQLEPDAKHRVLELMKQEVQSEKMSISDVLAQADAVRVTLRPDENGNTPSVSDLLNEVREERDAEILRSLGFGDSAGDSSV